MQHTRNLYKVLTHSEKAQLLQWAARDLGDAWAYERSHKKEFDAQIKANEEA